MPETMACVIISDRVQDLTLSGFGGYSKIDSTNIETKYKYQRRIIMKYMNNDIPSVISHFTASIRNNFSEERKPLLRSLRFWLPNMSSERFSSRKGDLCELGDGDQELIFSSLAETHLYEKYPVILSSLAHEENYATTAYSENIQLQLCDLFSFGRNSFEKLIEIQEIINDKTNHDTDILRNDGSKTSVLTRFEEFPHLKSSIE